MIQILSVFTSLSGNTAKTVKIAEKYFEEMGCQVTSVLLDTVKETVIDFNQYDLVMLGTYTEDFGRTPPEMKRCVWHNRRVTVPVVVIGTGDSLWGEENYCGAVDKLAHFYKSKFPVFKTEFYPTSEKEYYQIKQWAETVYDLLEEPSIQQEKIICLSTT